MNTLRKIILAIVGIIFAVYSTNAIMDFLAVPLSSYGSYLAWFVALILFYAILPSRVGTLFD